MKYYLSEATDVLKEVGSDRDGLSEAEAASRLERDGRNKPAEGRKKGRIAWPVSAKGGQHV